MQVLDLRRERRHEAPLDVWASGAAELLAMLALLEHGDDAAFDVGVERVAELRDAIPPGVQAVLDEAPPQTWNSLQQLVGLLDEPGDVEQLATLLADQPERAWRALLAEACDEAGADPALLDAHLDGEVAADVLRDAVAGCADWRAEVVAMLTATTPAAFGRWVLGVLEPTHAAVADTLLAEAMGPIRREVEARRRQLADGGDVDAVLLEATNGFELGADLPIRRILLTPSFWFRPWLLIGRCDGSEVITSPVAEEHLVLPSQAPPLPLVKVCKALADEGRLRLLRRMGGGPIQLADAMEELDVAKTTAHHHLAILRQAGLVVVRGEGRGTTYALRTDPSATAAEMLRTYLGSPASAPGLRASS